jgi:hypothetical protein
LLLILLSHALRVITSAEVWAECCTTRTPPPVNQAAHLAATPALLRHELCQATLANGF